jgi:hypothetical protein
VLAAILRFFDIHHLFDSENNKIIWSLRTIFMEFVGGFGYMGVCEIGKYFE